MQEIEEKETGLMSAVAVQNNNTSDTVLRAVIIYDDFDAAIRATALLERVATRTDDVVKWDIKPWKFDVLRQPSLAALTGAVAANADLVVLALRRTNPIPAELLAWLKNWAQQRRIQDAAVLALPSEDNASEDAWKELKTFATGQGLVFLDRNSVGIEENGPPFGRRWQPQSTASELPRLFAGRPPLPSHWGINE